MPSVVNDAVKTSVRGTICASCPSTPGRPEGIMKTFPLRGIKDTPPYLHDGHFKRAIQIANR
jgi:cytochrome c peroxidase